jgi:hypothetical protein
MARWLVNRHDTQFAVNGMSELRDMAKVGRLGPGDLVQPPGQQGWVYAIEIPELAGHLPDEEPVEVTGRSGGGLKVVALLGLAAIAAGAGYTAYDLYGSLPVEPKTILDTVKFSEVVVTGKSASLVADPEPTASVVGPAPAGARYELLAKRGDFYKTRDEASGTEGWIAVDQVMPAYRLGGGEVIAKYDPLYNPDRFLQVQNASWQELPDPKRKNITVFQFMLRNEAAYDMTDLVLVARIKDARGHDLEQVEFPVRGVVPALGSTMVGTITDPKTKERELVTQATFEQQAAAEPDLALEYADGVEVEMKTAEWSEATIDIVELRALPRPD